MPLFVNRCKRTRRKLPKVFPANFWEVRTVVPKLIDREDVKNKQMYDRLTTAEQAAHKLLWQEMEKAFGK